MEATFHSYLTEAVYTMEREKCQRPESAPASGDQDQPVDIVQDFLKWLVVKPHMYLLEVIFFHFIISSFDLPKLITEQKKI